MPQITLEYTANCRHNDQFSSLFHSIHKVIHKIGGISLDNCKSRAIPLDNFLIANGDSSHAFAHLSVRFVEGRHEETRIALGQRCLELLKGYFSESINTQKIQLTVEVQDIQLTHYHKYPEGTLTRQ